MARSSGWGDQTRQVTYRVDFDIALHARRGDAMRRDGLEVTSEQDRGYAWVACAGEPVGAAITDKETALRWRSDSGCGKQVDVLVWLPEADFAR